MASRFEAEAAEIGPLADRQFQRLRKELGPVVARLEALSPALFATIARGSSDNAAAFAGYVAGLRLGLPAASLPPSLASVYGSTLRLERACVLAVSQSGESPDLNLAVAHAKAGGAFTLGLVNEGDSALGRSVEIALEIGAGHETAVAATKTFLLSATALLHLIGAWARDATLLAALEELPRVLGLCEQVEWGDALELLAGADDLFVVGRGPTLPIAQELALKLKEVCGMHAEALSAAELLHGPIALAAPTRPAIVLAGDAPAQASVLEAVSRLRTAGAPVVLLVASGRRTAGRQIVTVPDAQHPLLQPLAALYAAYPLVADLARARGRDPDRPPHLVKVTRTL